MKRLLVTLVLVALATTFAFSQTVNDNTGQTLDGKHSGTGTFTCTVLTPLAIQSITDVDMGEFVVSLTAYTPTANNTFTFNITGDGNHGFFYTLTEDNTDPLATIVIAWTASDASVVGVGVNTGATLASGTFGITGTVTSLTAIGSGAPEFEQGLTVSYNSF